MNKPNQRVVKINRRRGASLVEFALVFPLIMLLMVGGADFSRMFFSAVTVANGSATGSLWGSQSVVKSVQYNEIEQRAESDAIDVDLVSATAELYCECSSGSTVSCLEGETACPGYGAPKVFSKTTVEQSFSTLLDWPFVPHDVTVSRETFIRVQ